MKIPLLNIPRVHLKIYFTLPLFTLLGIGILFSNYAITPGPVTDALKVAFDLPILLLLNAIPVFAILSVLWMALGNLFYSAAITLCLTDVMSYINLLKIEGRDDPFVPADVFLLREGLSAVGEYEMKLYPHYIATIVICTLALVVLGIAFTTSRPKPIMRAVVGLVLSVSFVATVPTVYADNDLYSSFEVTGTYNITAVYNTLGFNYCFLHNVYMYPVDKPEGYSSSDVKQWMKEDLNDEKDADVTPNVIFIMCEAFSDIANDPSLDYPDGSTNPLQPYNEIAASDRAYSGHIVVSNYGAGTANTEYDVVTGMPTLMLSVNTASAFRTVRRPLNTVARLFKNQGYSTYFMHPGDSWFYNRSSVYNYFGIDDQVFIDDAFNADDRKGNLVSDAAFLRVLTEDFSERIASDDPLFVYSVTIQNHQAYSTSKYNDPSILEARPTSKDLPIDQMQTLNVYLHGLRDSANMLSELTKYLDTVDEPTLLVFFGDHRPTLGNDYSVYKSLGMNVGYTENAEQRIETNKTPFLLWANEAYSDDFKKFIPALSLPESAVISDHYLGAAVTELIGYSGKDAYYDFLNEARLTLPVVCGNAYMRADGTFTDTLIEEEKNIVFKTNSYLYFRMKEQKVQD